MLHRRSYSPVYATSRKSLPCCSIHRGSHFRAVCYSAEVLPAPNIGENTNFFGKSYFLGKTMEGVQLIEEIKKSQKISCQCPFKGSVKIKICQA